MSQIFLPQVINAEAAEAAERRKPGQITDADRQWWAFVRVRPVARPEVKTADAVIHNDVDRFILAHLESASLTPSI